MWERQGEIKQGGWGLRERQMEQWHNVFVALECVEEQGPGCVCVCVSVCESVRAYMSSFHVKVWTFDELSLSPPKKIKNKTKYNTLHLDNHTTDKSPLK